MGVEGAGEGGTWRGAGAEGETVEGPGAPLGTVAGRVVVETEGETVRPPGAGELGVSGVISGSVTVGSGVKGGGRSPIRGT